jgi:hypothetical protein
MLNAYDTEHRYPEPQCPRPHTHWWDPLEPPGKHGWSRLLLELEAEVIPDL